MYDTPGSSTRTSDLESLSFYDTPHWSTTPSQELLNEGDRLGASIVGSAIAELKDLGTVASE